MSSVSFFAKIIFPLAFCFRIKQNEISKANLSKDIFH